MKLTLFLLPYLLALFTIIGKRGGIMSRKIYFEKQESRKDGWINFRFLIEGEKQVDPVKAITVSVHGQWYQEEMLKMDTLDLQQFESFGTLLRYIASEALKQYDKPSSGSGVENYVVIPPDRTVDFDEIINFSRGEFPEVILPGDFSPQ